MRFILILQALSLVVPVGSGAQTAAPSGWPPAPGSRARILSPVLGEKKQSGVVMSATQDTLFFRQSGASGDRALLTSQITSMEIARGTHTRKGRGALIGFIIGAGTGAGLAAATYKESPGLAIDFGRGGDAAFGGVFGGLLGAAIGALVGTRSTDTWVPLAAPR